MNSLELISLYENVAVITAKMLDAARLADWELLAQLETDCTSQVQRLRENEIPIELPTEIREKKILVIKKILSDDKEIRNITEPWMAQLASLMKSSSANLKLSQTYGANYAG
jgi:flagellar protein FliT